MATDDPRKTAAQLAALQSQIGVEGDAKLRVRFAEGRRFWNPEIDDETLRREFIDPLLGDLWEMVNQAYDKDQLARSLRGVIDHALQRSLEAQRSPAPSTPDTGAGSYAP